MAFKREGTDTSLLQDLQRRRVSEILAGHIPEDEALLLKNGKYACTLCQHRPVLDTIEMLAIHRKGKRHLTSLTRHLSDMKRREQENERRVQEASLRMVTAGKDSALSCTPKAKFLGSAAVKGTKKRPRLKLMKSAPYSSCCKKKAERNANAPQPGTQVGSESRRNSSGIAENPLVKAYLKSCRRKGDFVSAVEKTKRNLSRDGSPLEREAQSSKPLDTPEGVSPTMSQAKASIAVVDTCASEEEVRERERAKYFLNLRM